MSIDQTRAQVISSVWQAIAQSGVDLSSVPQDQQEKLVGKIADSLLVAVNAMLDEVEKTGYRIPTPRAQALDALSEAIQPKKSHTFRSGKTGGWKQHFSDEHKKLFKDVAGDLLVRLGYERSNDW